MRMMSDLGSYQPVSIEVSREILSTLKIFLFLLECSMILTFLKHQGALFIFLVQLAIPSLIFLAQIPDTHIPLSSGMCFDSTWLLGSLRWRARRTLRDILFFGCSLWLMFSCWGPGSEGSFTNGRQYHGCQFCGPAEEKSQIESNQSKYHEFVLMKHVIRSSQNLRGSSRRGAVVNESNQKP